MGEDAGGFVGFIVGWRIRKYDVFISECAVNW